MKKEYQNIITKKSKNVKIAWADNNENISPVKEKWNK